MPHQAPVSAVRKIRSRISADQVAPPRAVAAISRGATGVHAASERAQAASSSSPAPARDPGAGRREPAEIQGLLTSAAMTPRRVRTSKATVARTRVVEMPSETQAMGKTR